MTSHRSGVAGRCQKSEGCQKKSRQLDFARMVARKSRELAHLPRKLRSRRRAHCRKIRSITRKSRMPCRNLRTVAERPRKGLQTFRELSKLSGSSPNIFRGSADFVEGAPDKPGCLRNQGLERKLGQGLERVQVPLPSQSLWLFPGLSRAPS